MQTSSKLPTLEEMWVKIQQQEEWSKQQDNKIDELEDQVNVLRREVEETKAEHNDTFKCWSLH